MRIIALAAAAAAALSATLLATAGPAAAQPDDTSAVVPSTAAPGGRVTFEVFCPGARDADSATLTGTTLGLPEHIPMAPESEAEAGSFVTTVTLPSDIQPGTYHPSLDCADGTGTTGTLTVSPTGAPAAGDGTTSAGSTSPLTAIGLGLVGLGALAGAGAVGRRRLRRHA